MNQTAQDYYIKGIDRCKNDNFAEAIEWFSQALAVDSKHHEARYNRAKSFFKLQRFSEALDDFNILIELQPDNAFYYSERAVALHLSGDNGLSLQDLNKAVELEPHKPFRYSSRAFIKERMGDLKGAIADYEKTIALDPEDAIAFNNKGLIEEKLGYIEQSNKSFERADRLDPKYDPEKTKKAPASDLPKIELHKKKEQKLQREEKLTMKGYLRLVKSLLTTRSERKAFKEFLKGFLKRKS
ncbi:TPR repeat protein [Fulvivirga imtechensis AK7]|uniref:TPR repeat protein n=1 Tax=Fulvivirga imtechensis AK7 TaxID=1237149 RepID=L8JWI9_9BACT|nr:tetratricopeptide repeat protein [Fulvivirga imtechensis]ELR71984.1 TPR repeat protein [Fulvivirga imtechensis AK7]